jgi:ubiquinone/menaquinone biosynthesis C-methylase UbiE
MEALMKWSHNEIDRLHTILEQISFDLAPVDGKHILVLCSSTGEVAFWLAEMMEQGKVTGVELDLESLEIASHASHEMGLEGMVEFLLAEKQHIPLPDAAFEGLVREFIVYPSASPTEIGQPEMARLLAPGGRMILTDVLVTKPIPAHVREELEIIGLDYVRQGTQVDFRSWMASAGLVNVSVQDLTPTLQSIWEERRENDPSASHQLGYNYLLDHPEFGLGKAILYIYACGEKPKIDQ